MAILTVVLFAGCKKDDYVEVIGVCPLVISTDPTNGANSVPYNKVITAKINEKMDPATITEASFTLQQGTTSIAGTVTYNDSTAIFTPAVALAVFTTYKGTIKNSAKDLLGNALQADYVWTFTTMPQISLLASPVIGGTTIGGGSFAMGASVTVTATPNPGYVFVNWTENGTVVSLVNSPLQINATNLANNGTEVSTSSSYTFTMTGNRTLTANFAVIVLGNFAVNLSSNPAAGGSTSGGGTYVENSTRIVSATANTGYTFVNWTEGGLIVSSSSTYTFTLIANKTLVANFLINTYSLTTSAVNGSVAKSPSQATYNFGSTVVLTPTANAGYTFTSWTGDASGSSNPLSVIMNANKAITANFTLNTYTLNVISTNGSVVKVPSQATYNHGASVQLTATPNVGYTFTTWSGDATGSTNPLTVNMTSNKTITANYTAIVGALTLNVTAVNGTVAKDPNLVGYLVGTSVLLTATPNAGYEFTSWSGDVTGSVNPSTIIMNANKNVTANFTLAAPKGPGTINLGGAAIYTVLSKTGISTTVGSSVTGNIGVSPAAATAITGFGLIMDVTNTFSKSSPSSLVSGNVYASDYTVPTPANISTAVSDMETAFTTANGLTASVVTELGAGDITGMTLVPALYKWGTGLLISSAGVTLTGGANDTWVFQIGQGMTVADGAIIHLAGGAQAKNIYWITASDAIIGTTAVFNGNILSQTLIALKTGSKVTGRLLGQTAVTLDAATVVFP